MRKRRYTGIVEIGGDPYTFISPIPYTQIALISLFSIIFSGH
jgi:hypothetical protein